MKNNLKNALAKANGLERKRRTDIINERGRRAITPEEEKARLRKAVYTLVTLMESMHPELSSDPAVVELKEYYGIYEQIKKDVKEEIGI